MVKEDVTLVEHATHIMHDMLQGKHDECYTRELFGESQPCCAGQHAPELTHVALGNVRRDQRMLLWEMCGGTSACCSGN